MNYRKMRTYQPVAVSIAAMILFLALAVTTITAECQKPVQRPEKTVSSLYLSNQHEERGIQPQAEEAAA